MALNGNKNKRKDKKDKMDRSKMLKPLKAFTIIAGFAFLVIDNALTRMKYSQFQRELSYKQNPEYMDNRYYNIDPHDQSVKLPLPTNDYPIGKGPVIALLVSGRPRDVGEAQTALKSLEFLKGDKNPEHPSPVLIFNEGDLSKLEELSLVSSTNRPISFPRVDFTSFPEGFDPATEKGEFSVTGRSKWGYYQMIRFWTTTIWEHAAIERFDTVMRIDSDSCFKEVNPYLPNFHHDDLFYHSQYVGVVPKHGSDYIEGMYDFVKNWMADTHQPSEPGNALLWHYATTMWESQRTLPLLMTNFELSKKSFMQREDVKNFHEAITEREPFYVLRHRWGDAILRYLLLAVFASPGRVSTIAPTGYFHKQGCSKMEVEEALAALHGASVKMIE